MGGGSPEVQREPVEQTSTTTSEPWEEQKPFLTQGFEAAQSDILNNPLSFFPGQTFVNQSPETLAGLGMQTQRALDNPMLSQAQGSVSDTLSGNYMANPYMGDLTGSVASSVIPAVQGAYGMAGRSGTSPGAIEAMSRGIARGVAPQAFEDYRSGRTEMERAAALSPQLAQADYADIGQLRDVGAAREAQSARELQDQMARHEFESYEPYQRLPAYMGLVQGNYGGTTSSTGTGTQLLPYQQSNPLLMGLGGLSSLAGIGGSIFGGFGPFGKFGPFG